MVNSRHAECRRAVPKSPLSLLLEIQCEQVRSLNRYRIPARVATKLTRDLRGLDPSPAPPVHCIGDTCDKKACSISFLVTWIQRSHSWSLGCRGEDCAFARTRTLDLSFEEYVAQWNTVYSTGHPSGKIVSRALAIVHVSRVSRAHLNPGR